MYLDGRRERGYIQGVKTTYYRGTERTPTTPRAGTCLAECPRIAADYGDRVFEVEIDLAGLVVIEVALDAPVETLCNGDFPGDTIDARAAYVADGIDAIEYRDMSPRLRTHTTLRLLSPRAVARATVVCELD